MKKLFTLVALLTCFLGAKAETVVDFEKDYSTADSWAHGWLNEEDHIKFEDGAIHFHSDEAQSAFYDFQYQLHPGIPSLDNDASYTITLRIKGTVAQDIHASFSGSNTPGMISVPTEWQDVVLENCVNDPNAQYFANSGCLLIQPGDYVGDIWISYIKITHEEKASQRPVEWLEQLTNGDAETAWPEWSLAKNDEGININWRGDRTGEICAWSIVRGKNIDPSQTPDEVKDPDGNIIPEGKPRPFPCDIEDDGTGNHVFVVHSTAADNQFADWQAWDNQFFIQSPKAWKSGTKVKIKFRYKAEKAATAQTQIHRQNPSHYLFYQAIGDVKFTTEWQEFDNTITFSDSQANGWSVAFNLNVDNKEPNTFYFDDLSWQVMKLDEGLFVASSNTTTGIEYDYDNAIEFQGPTDDGVYWATVGTEGKQDTWVNQLMISTVRGENAAFKGATIKPSGTIKGNDEDNWQDYTATAQYKIDLPAAGVWQIFISPETNQILFMMTEGEELVIKEPVDVVANATEMTIQTVTREDLKDSKNNEGVITVNEEADDPAGVNVGGEGHNGQTYDNQFFIKANRALEAGEATVVEFKYKAATAARSTTQCHGETPGAYMHWNCIPAVNFTDEWQDYKEELTVASEANGMWCISFDLAVMKEANTYEIKDVKWYLKNDTEGKTLENLIDAEGTANFWVKIGAGTDPYPYGTDPSGINNVVAKSNASTATYNLAGQRISKEYKGVVVKNGKKVVVK